MTLMIHARIDPRLKKSALPFPVTVPNKETVAAMMETNNPGALKRYGSFRELRERI
jgi:antitoxin component of RelBE/YafQ-DinJ toxin-antitoxin module